MIIMYVKTNKPSDTLKHLITFAMKLYVSTRLNIKSICLAVDGAKNVRKTQVKLHEIPETTQK